MIVRDKDLRSNPALGEKLLAATRVTDPEAIASELAKLDQTLREYESANGMSTDALISGLRDGSVREEDHHFRWISFFHLRECVRERLASVRAGAAR